LAMNAVIIAEGKDGRRSIPIEEFFHGFYMTALEPSEILVEIQIPEATSRSGGAYYKVERKVGDYATAGTAIHLELDDNNVCIKAGIALTNVSAVPLKLERAEQLLTGQTITDELIDQAGTIASEDCEPDSDLRGSEAYKRSIAKTITIKMIQKALERAKS
ncbi:MAG: FAD binding domain-containing protein, partial [Flavobacteriaceae bacterium]